MASASTATVVVAVVAEEMAAELQTVRRTVRRMGTTAAAAVDRPETLEAAAREMRKVFAGMIAAITPPVAEVRARTPAEPKGALPLLS